ncbi:hypothetical protein HK104_001314 [Borealophlyctis nickersoniae]|nr:hypothetical protein HK104_001314 [Borealophlyctis nickersoniae]
MRRENAGGIAVALPPTTNDPWERPWLGSKRRLSLDCQALSEPKRAVPTQTPNTWCLAAPNNLVDTTAGQLLLLPTFSHKHHNDLAVATAAEATADKHSPLHTPKTETSPPPPNGPRPADCVDYTSSNDISPLDIHASWKMLMEGCAELPQGLCKDRLENILWRKWWQSTYRLGRLPPEKLDWNKDSDPVALYGPLYLHPDSPHFSQPKPSQPAPSSATNHRSILKKPPLEIGPEWLVELRSLNCSNPTELRTRRQELLFAAIGSCTCDPNTCTRADECRKGLRAGEVGRRASCDARVQGGSYKRNGKWGPQSAPLSGVKFNLMVEQRVIVDSDYADSEEENDCGGTWPKARKQRRYPTHASHAKDRRKFVPPPKRRHAHAASSTEDPNSQSTAGADHPNPQSTSKSVRRKSSLEIRTTKQISSTILKSSDSVADFGGVPLPNLPFDLFLGKNETGAADVRSLVLLPGDATPDPLLGIGTGDATLVDLLTDIAAVAAKDAVQIVGDVLGSVGDVVKATAKGLGLGWFLA